MTDKRENYRQLLLEAQSLFAGERNEIANAANLAALIWHRLADLNWAGFYFREGDGLVLGPFQGKPACVRIDWGQGVCGSAAAAAKTLIVPDVHAFAGHIACDGGSNSELVVPLIRDGRVIGVIDLDSPLLARFDAEDAAGIEALARAYVTASI
jgi:L-methionine (R)-S-oxide reductase